uniref:Regulator of microtubule dynamics protein 1 n=2 Tax=Graphocephala atropunctata TaxID=36148 RepID=A0A1B6LQ53_9HEMI
MSAIKRFTTLTAVANLLMQVKPSTKVSTVLIELSKFLIGKPSKKCVLLLSGKVVKSRVPLLLLWTVPFMSSAPEGEGSGEAKPKPDQQTKETKNAIQESDELFESNKYQEAISALLPFKDGSDVEVLWRLSRAQYKVSQSSSVSDKEKKELIHEAYERIKKALELDDSHWAIHKWMSVLLDAESEYEGIKARVTQLENVKRHMLRAVELNPTDATTHYMLGSWCYQIADMSWFQRKIAATIFAAPPTSTFEEALHFFSKAEEIQPKFYSPNLLMLGKTLIKLQKPEEAARYLNLAKDYPSSTEEDDSVQKEATELLKKLKI